MRVAHCATRVQINVYTFPEEENKVTERQKKGKEFTKEAL